MNAQEHLRLFFAAWMRHDADEMSGFYAPDAVIEDPTLPKPRQARDEIRRYYAEMFSELENPYHELLDHAHRGERVWFEWTFGSGGVDRPRVRYHGVSIQTLERGLIAHDASFWTPDG
jgi:ketosteroid isomerase-like protein